MFRSMFSPRLPICIYLRFLALLVCTLSLTHLSCLTLSSFDVNEAGSRSFLHEREKILLRRILNVSKIDFVVPCEIFLFPYLEIYGTFLDVCYCILKKNSFVNLHHLKKNSYKLKTHTHTDIRCSQIYFNKTRVSSIATKYQIRPIFAPIVMFISHYLLCLK